MGDKKHMHVLQKSLHTKQCFRVFPFHSNYVHFCNMKASGAARMKNERVKEEKRLKESERKRGGS